MEKITIFIVTSTLHMGIDGDWSEITLVTRDRSEAEAEYNRIAALPYKEYHWYGADLEEYEV